MLTMKCSSVSTVPHGWRPKSSSSISGSWKKFNVDLDQPSEPAEDLPKFVSGNFGDDVFDTEVPDDKQFLGDNQRLSTGPGDDEVDVIFAPGGNRIDLGSGDDMIFAGTNNRILAGPGNDALFIGYAGGNNTVTGDSGADQFWIVTDEGALPEMANIITDFVSGEDVIGFGSVSSSFIDSLTLTLDGNDTIINGLGQDLAIVRNSTLSESDLVFA